MEILVIIVTRAEIRVLPTKFKKHTLGRTSVNYKFTIVR